MGPSRRISLRRRNLAINGVCVSRNYGPAVTDIRNFAFPKTTQREALNRPTSGATENLMRATLGRRWFVATTMEEGAAAPCTSPITTHGVR